ncbi:hypothetical protein SUGI_0606470 [Cryptomeria japonica]|nr:hypothetical protein SUGI_0606470 [Cryptomeria japonica]
MWEQSHVCPSFHRLGSRDKVGCAGIESASFACERSVASHGAWTSSTFLRKFAPFYVLSLILLVSIWIVLLDPHNELAVTVDRLSWSYMNPTGP